MSYALEKKIRDRKVKTIKTVVFTLVSLLLCVGVVLSCIYPPSTWKYYFRLPKIDTRLDGELRIHFLDVGQGDSTIIELPDGKTMLIDGGNGSDETSSTILRYLNALQIKEIDYLLVTHADTDHCGGLDKVVANKKIKKAIVPKTKETVNGEYASFYSTLVQEGCEIVTASNALHFSVLSDECAYKLCFLAPSATKLDEIETVDGEMSNEYSAVVWLDYNGVSTLFTGDISKSVETDLRISDGIGLFDNYGVELDSTEIIKVAHHGSADSSDKEFLGYLQAQTAIISCGVENEYGHPSQEVLTSLTALGIQTYRTDLHGGIIVRIPKGESRWSMQTFGKE